jgi:dihydroflavonol-4-reductase
MREEIYIVTGATGFVGSNLVPKLLKKGKTVYALARDPEKVKLALPDTAAKLFYGDVRDKNAVLAMFDKEDADYTVVHTAAVVLIGGKKKEYANMFDVNVNGVKNIVDICVEKNARLLHVSSVHAITEPKKRATTYEIEHFDPKTVKGKYAKSKAEGSAIVMDAVKNRGLKAVLVHPSGITGPNDFGNSHLTQLVIDYLAGRIPAAVKGGYDFVDVRDVCDGIISAVENFKSGERYLLTNEYYTVKQTLDYLYELTGFKKINSSLPMWLAKVGLPFLSLGAKLKKKRPLYTLYSLYTLKSNSNFSHEHATKEFNYAPRPLKESLRDTLAFLDSLKADADKAAQNK